MIVFINIIAVSLFIFIIWWFWLSSPKTYKSGTEQSSNQVIDVIVENGVYTPSRIEVSQGQVLTLRLSSQRC